MNQSFKDRPVILVGLFYSKKTNKITEELFINLWFDNSIIIYKIDHRQSLHEIDNPNSSKNSNSVESISFKFMT